MNVVPNNPESDIPSPSTFNPTHLKSWLILRTQPEKNGYQPPAYLVHVHNWTI
ncbi:hypothetical protein PtB15_14B439 [Puccinia triticina]|nr:hypothetical protein PtB15_14B439 [Puccinia triticina]